MDLIGSQIEQIKQIAMDLIGSQIEQIKQIAMDLIKSTIKDNKRQLKQINLVDRIVLMR